MKKNTLKKHQLFQNDAIELVVVEKVEVESAKGGPGGYYRVNLEPLAVIIIHAGDTLAVNMQGSIVSIDQLPEDCLSL